MLKRKNTESFSKEIAKELKISQKAVKNILVFGMKNICRMIEKGEEIRLDHFGTFYFNKKSYGAYLKKGREMANEKRKNNSPNNDMGTNNK